MKISKIISTFMRHNDVISIVLKFSKFCDKNLKFKLELDMRYKPSNKAHFCLGESYYQ